jgi:Cytochrome P460
MKRRWFTWVSTCWLVMAALVTNAQGPRAPVAAKEWSTADATPEQVAVEGPAYTADERLKLPEKYREWIFLSSGLDMSYGERLMGHSMFDNVFAEPAAYREFMSTGLWPDGTLLVLEVRGAGQKGSINQHGRFQTGELMGLEVHVKDTKRFQGGWAFFGFRGTQPAQMIAMSAACYSCHQRHGAVDTTFVQFYPTLLEVATLKRTLSAGYKP